MQFSISWNSNINKINQLLPFLHSFTSNVGITSGRKAFSCSLSCSFLLCFNVLDRNSINLRKSALPALWLFKLRGMDFFKV